MAAANTYSQIASTTLGSAASSVTFSSIPATYTDLVLVMSIFPETSGGAPYIRATVNSDTASNYSFTYLLGNGTAASSGRATSVTGLLGSPTIGSSTTIPTQVMMNFQNYSNATTYKTVLTRNSDQNSGVVTAYVSLWRSTSAISSINIAGTTANYGTGSTFNLYGITAA